VQATWPDPYATALEKGDWELGFNFTNSGSNPQYQFNRWLHSNKFAPLGEKAVNSANMRYKNEAIDKALDAYRAEPDPAKQAAYMSIVVEQFMKDVPCVPLFFNPTWFEYSTKNLVGWPSADDPYAWPNVNGMQKTPILLRLQKK